MRRALPDRSTMLAARLLLAAMLLAACGGKTGLDRPRPDAGELDAAPPECTDDRHCDDGLECTEDRCEARACVNRPRDEVCDDGAFCTVSDRCDPTLGCVSDPNPCSDGVSCTEDTCDERMDRCEHAPSAGLCPLSHRCDLERGCVARALIHDPNALWEVDLPSGTFRRLSRTGVSFTDLALHPDGTAYAINRRSLFELDQDTGLVRRIAAVTDENVALDVSPDGQLLTAGDRVVSRLDRVSGRSEPFARFPPGLFASGDIAFVRGRMLVTATRTPGSSVGAADRLLEVPLDGGELTEVGEIGFPCVWGLAPFGDTLYGFTCQGLLLEIDPDTGGGRSIATLMGLQVGGAAAR